MSRPDQFADTPPDPFDTAGKWLAAHYQLTNRGRDRVKTATLQGQPVSDPRLQEAVRGLASEILANRLRMPGIRLYYYAVGAVSGIAGIAALAIALSPSGQHSQVRWILLTVLAFIIVPFCFLWLPRRFRRKVEKALRVNSSDG
jgi:hypothetical protein